MSDGSPEPALTVIGEIASGGMGSVELARLADADGDRLVAVKRMHPEYSRDPEFVRMFRDEIWLTGSLRHPNVVGLVGWGEDEEGPYFAMEYVDGVALARIALTGKRAGEPIPHELVAFACARAAEGLHAAHALEDGAGRSLELVHRDVTPSNILVGFDGGVKITDFGIAKAAGKSSHTRTGIIKGKIAYMSPEYASRRPVDGRADLYSLGIVMFELIAGKVPFDARGDLELLKLVAYAQPQTLGAAVPGVDAELAAVVDRLLQKDPAARFSTGVELADALDTWLASRGHQRPLLTEALQAYAHRHMGTAHRKLRATLEDDTTTVRRTEEEPKADRFETRTITLFQPRERPDRRPSADHDAERPRTRRVAVSVPPPSESPGLARPSVATLPTPAEVPLEVGARFSEPPPPPGRARQSRAVVGGVIAGSAAALVLVVLSVMASSRSPAATSGRAVAPSDTTPPAPDPAPPLPASAPAVSAEGLPLEPAPSASVPLAPSRGPSAPAKPRPGVGTSKPSFGRVSGNKGTKPCTPDSFDYPACLKR
jgi:serine/threonine protein kinase